MKFEKVFYLKKYKSYKQYFLPQLIQLNLYLESAELILLNDLQKILYIKREKITVFIYV